MLNSLSRVTFCRCFRRFWVVIMTVIMIVLLMILVKAIVLNLILVKRMKVVIVLLAALGLVLVRTTLIRTELNIDTNHNNNIKLL